MCAFLKGWEPKRGGGSVGMVLAVTMLPWEASRLLPRLLAPNASLKESQGALLSLCQDTTSTSGVVPTGCSYAGPPCSEQRCSSCWGSEQPLLLGLCCFQSTFRGSGAATEQAGTQRRCRAIWQVEKKPHPRTRPCLEETVLLLSPQSKTCPQIPCWDTELITVFEHRRI